MKVKCIYDFKTFRCSGCLNRSTKSSIFEIELDWVSYITRRIRNCFVFVEVKNE